ncbi:MAG TPA: hypothetical protein VGV89_05765 [Thermoplasmata archaeon]|nr:hypothetical protein [Thermoplasmata archaeon]
MGLFPANSPVYSDLVLVVEIAIAAMLVVGMFVARTGRIRVHMYLQSSMVLVNLPVVLSWMVPQYLTYVLPGLPREIGDPVYLFPTVMLVLGAAAESIGVYILLVAVTNWIPERIRFRNYKLWMRGELVLWWSVLVFGFSTYYIWYVPS